MKTFVSLVILLGLMAVTRPAQAQDGAVLYKSKCQVCHGADGKGSRRTKLGVKDFNAPDVAKETDAEFATVNKKGKGKMPKYDGKLTDDQIAQVVKFIRSLK